jgi:hypothetical protein
LPGIKRNGFAFYLKEYQTEFSGLLIPKIPSILSKKISDINRIHSALPRIPQGELDSGIYLDFPGLLAYRDTSI